ncbi:DNA primase noncatalytic subunit PriX [Metallosphaera tengchongensis]|uniref:DNA primase noncatalytic subunit PriX n=1 Tax=Metallosphaera tengchongensis TaxID=1532350 RepID=A0A6N0NTL3_9CREN|nr:DNA primase noncatalytic subunit PriX [Metallosphaera tengchongensis]QKQ99168.1 DNA primase noncatalytic subunit PriX [Metallosphaera tengchongensis]
MSHKDKREFQIQLKYPDGSPAGYVVYNDGVSRVFDEKNQFLFEVEGIFPPRPRNVSMDWIDKVLERGLEDGRKRFILYVASRYLMNVKKLPEDEALERIKSFYYKNGGKVYDTWIRSVLRGVKAKGLMPPSLNSLQVKDRDLYQAIKTALEKNDKTTL